MIIANMRVFRLTQAQSAGAQLIEDQQEAIEALIGMLPTKEQSGGRQGSVSNVVVAEDAEKGLSRSQSLTKGLKRVHTSRTKWAIEIFKTADKDNNGRLTHSELRAFLEDEKKGKLKSAHGDDVDVVEFLKEFESGFDNDSKDIDLDGF